MCDRAAISYSDFVICFTLLKLDHNCVTCNSVLETLQLIDISVTRWRLVYWQNHVSVCIQRRIKCEILATFCQPEMWGENCSTCIKILCKNFNLVTSKAYKIIIFRIILLTWQLDLFNIMLHI